MIHEKEQLKVVIVDDEERSRIILKKLIEEYVDHVVVVAMAVDVLDGLRIVRQYQPDVVFLDIEMPNYSGFKLLEHFEEREILTDDSLDNGVSLKQNFDVVFTTAYEKYAVKAYKASAIGYLLKPIDIDELIDIFKKIFKKRKEDTIDSSLHQPLPKNLKRLIFPTQGGLIYLDENEICYLDPQVDIRISV